MSQVGINFYLLDLAGMGDPLKDRQLARANESEMWANRRQ